MRIDLKEVDVRELSPDDKGVLVSCGFLIAYMLLLLVMIFVM